MAGELNPTPTLGKRQRFSFSLAEGNARDPDALNSLDKKAETLDIWCGSNPAEELVDRDTKRDT